MTEYTTFDLTLTGVDESEAMDALYCSNWGKIETTVQELSDMDLIIEWGGVSMFFIRSRDTYVFVDDEA